MNRVEQVGGAMLALLVGLQLGGWSRLKARDRYAFVRDLGALLEQ